MSEGRGAGGTACGSYGRRPGEVVELGPPGSQPGLFEVAARVERRALVEVVIAMEAEETRGRGGVVPDEVGRGARGEVGELEAGGGRGGGGRCWRRWESGRSGRWAGS